MPTEGPPPGPPAAPERAFSPEDFDQKVKDHAAMRTLPEAWLALMAEEVTRGNITAPGVTWFVGSLVRSRTEDLLPQIAAQYPKATSLFTYMDAKLAQPVFNLKSRTLIGSWPSTYSLNGLGLARGTWSMQFANLDISRAEIDFLMSSKGKIPLGPDAYTTASNVIWEQNQAHVDHCSDAERLFIKLMEHQTELEDRKLPFCGVMLKDADKIVSILKFDGEHSALALRTVKTEDGRTEFFRGMLYALEKDLYFLMHKRASEIWSETEKTTSIANAWLSVDVKDLAARAKENHVRFAKNGLRFVHTSPLYEPPPKGPHGTYSLMHRFIKEVEKGKAPVKVIPLFGSSER